MSTSARVLGGGLVAAGLLANKWTLERTLTADGAITSTPVLMVVALLQIALVGGGLLLIHRAPPIPRSGIALAATALAGALGFAEAGLRVLPDYRPVPRWYVGERSDRPSRHFVPDAVTGWRMRSHHEFQWEISGRLNTYRSNAQGMRDPDDFKATCGKPRVVLLGDSFVFGTGVDYEQTVGPQLEDLVGHRADVFNLAMPGFGIDQMWMSLRDQALGLCPALLVVAFIDEDWDRSLTAFRHVEGMNKPTFLLNGALLQRATPADRPGPLLRLMVRHSALWRLGDLTMRNLGRNHEVGRWWSLNAAMLDAMARDAAGAGVPILFVRLAARGGWRTFPALCAHMDRTGTPFLDLGDPSAARDDVHLDRDDHIGPRGHAWLAGAILAWIRAERPATLSSLLLPTS